MDSPFANGTKWHPHLSSRLTYPGSGSPSTWTFFLEYVERATRIELAFSAWEADVLPLNYARGLIPRLAALSRHDSATMRKRTTRQVAVAR